jgi:hypothetical protein
MLVISIEAFKIAEARSRVLLSCAAALRDTTGRSLPVNRRRTGTLQQTAEIPCRE